MEIGSKENLIEELQQKLKSDKAKTTSMVALLKAELQNHITANKRTAEEELAEQQRAQAQALQDRVQELEQ